MFAKVLIPVLLSVSWVAASPIDTSAPSISDLGIASLQGFDDFNGADNFDGSRNVQVVQEVQQTVCQSLSARIVQQRLAILQEVAKRIISEQVCEVETQTVVLEQFQSGLQHFSKTIVRQTVEQVGFDANIAGLLGSLINSDGSLNVNDLGFDGKNIGKNTIVPKGDNWNDNTSPASTKKAKEAAKKAKAAAGKNNGNDKNKNNTTTASASQSTTSAANSESTSTASSAESTITNSNEASSTASSTNAKETASK